MRAHIIFLKLRPAHGTVLIAMGHAAVCTPATFRTSPIRVVSIFHVNIIYQGQVVRLAANRIVTSGEQMHLTTDSEIFMVLVPAPVLTRP